MAKQNTCNIDYKDKEAIRHISNTLLNIKCWFLGILVLVVFVFIVYVNMELAFPKYISGWQFVPYIFTLIGTIVLCSICLSKIIKYYEKHKLR